MPIAPSRPCRAGPGCRLLTTARDGFCDAHRRDMQRRQDAGRGSASSRGYGAQHRKRRAVVRADGPLCVACLALGRVTPMTVDDHIVPIKWGGSVDDLSNHQSLCQGHHDKKRSAESRGIQLRVVQGRGLVVVGTRSAKVTT